MSSTISKSVLTVILQEQVELNSTDYGTRYESKIRGINEVSQRIVTVPTSQMTILNLSSSIGAGTYITDNMKYLRMTNLDNENWVRLTFLSGSSNQFDVRLDPLQSHIVTNAKISGSAAGDSFGSFVNFDTLKAVANSSSVDMEMFVASS